MTECPQCRTMQRPADVGWLIVVCWDCGMTWIADLVIARPWEN